MLRVALPNKGTLAEPAATMMREAGYRQRSDSRDLSIADEENDIEFFYLRPKDIATYVGSGDLHLGRDRRGPQGGVGQPGAEPAGAGLRRLQVPVRRAGRGADQDRRRPRGQADRHLVPAPGARAPGPRPGPRRDRQARRRGGDLGAPGPGRRRRGRRVVRPHAAPARPRGDRRADRREPGHADRARAPPGPRADRRGRRDEAGVHRAAARRGAGPPVPDDGVRLPEDGQGRGREDHSRPAGADDLAPDDDKLGGRAVDGQADQGEQGDGPARRAGRQGDPHHRHPLVPRARTTNRP